MFVRQNQQQFRNSNADVQIFLNYPTNQSSTETVGVNSQLTWNKPPGVSHVYMMLIGAGGNGNSVDGGGSGAVTVWYGAAQHVPNSLIIHPGVVASSINTMVQYRNGSGDPAILLQAGSGNAQTGGNAFSTSPFAASGFCQSVAGMAGSSGDIPTPSSTTFLSGGAASGAVVSNYGYGTSSTNQPGSFRLQPIIVGSGGSGITSNPVPGGIGCGGGASSTSGKGGQAMVLIASW